MNTNIKMMKRVSLVATGLLMSASLSAKKPQQDLGGFALETVKSHASYRDVETDQQRLALVGDWWTAWGDPAIAALIETALVNNRDLEASAFRVDQARAAVVDARADLFPQLSLDVSASRNRRMDTGYTASDYVSAPVSVSYELDLWGARRHASKEAKAGAAASLFRHEAARISLSAQVAETVVLLRATYLEEDLVEQTLQTRRDGYQLVADRHSLGAVAELDLARAETELARAEQELIGVEQRKSRLINALATLLGEEAPNFEADESSEPLPAPPPFDPGTPVSLLQSRPDVAAVERDLAQAAERIGIAKAAFYPSITFGASAGWESSDFDEVFSGDKRIWSIGPRLHLPIFQGKRNTARLRKAKALFEERRALFEQSFLVALAEVQDSLSARNYLSRRIEVNARAADSARRASELSLVRYDAGLVSYLEVIDSERVALAMERTQLQLKVESLLADISLAKALGGGWQADES